MPVKSALLRIKADDNVKVGRHSLVPGRYFFSRVYADAVSAEPELEYGFLLSLQGKHTIGAMFTLSPDEVAAFMDLPSLRIATDTTLSWGAQA